MIVMRFFWDWGVQFESGSEPASYVSIIHTVLEVFLHSYYYTFSTDFVLSLMYMYECKCRRFCSVVRFGPDNIDHYSDIYYGRLRRDTRSGHIRRPRIQFTQAQDAPGFLLCYSPHQVYHSQVTDDLLFSTSSSCKHIYRSTNYSDFCECIMLFVYFRL
jgi:hypothetical protein